MCLPSNYEFHLVNLTVAVSVSCAYVQPAQCGLTVAHVQLPTRPNSSRLYDAFTLGSSQDFGHVVT